jgi:16S rRNA (uracil1498-N3)-methyltransferase
MITGAPAGRNETLPPQSPGLIIPPVIRRLYVSRLFVGTVPIEPAQARHARSALRLPKGTLVEVFDDGGAVATGTLIFDGASGAAVRIDQIGPAAQAAGHQVVIASAVPKGERADWMVEKLSELGVAEFIPLITDRGVVKPGGLNKRERWVRIATESAKQSRRSGVMQIAELRSVTNLLAELKGMEATSVVYLSTKSGASSLAEAVAPVTQARTLLLIGPEGGWSDAEIEMFELGGIIGARLTETVLRVETAAVAGAVIALLMKPAIPIMRASETFAPG